MQKTVIGKFPPRNPQQQQQHQPRLGHGQNNLSPRGSHYVILPPEEMPAAVPITINRINQEQDEEFCSLPEDGPCSLPTVRKISSDSLSSISQLIYDLNNILGEGREAFDNGAVILKVFLYLIYMLLCIYVYVYLIFLLFDYVI